MNFLSNVYYDFTNSVFINDINKAMILSAYENNVFSASSSSCLRKNSQLAAIGEFFEREFLYYINYEILHKKNESKLEGYSMKDGSSATYVNNYLVKKGVFFDTCGMSVHTKLEDSITNSLSEFIERQSFLFFYLSKENCTLIPNSVVKELSHIYYINNIYDNFRFYNISLIPSYNVILSKGIYNDTFIIALGAGNTLEEAINKCLNESNQLVKYSSKGNEQDNTPNKPNQDYMDVFKTIPQKELIKAYNFTDKSKIASTIELREMSSVHELESILNDLESICGINPILFIFKHPRLETNIYVTKIVDFNWFPSLLPKTYGNEVYKYIEEKTGISLDRKCNFIPFP